MRRDSWFDLNEASMDLIENLAELWLKIYPVFFVISSAYLYYAWIASVPVGSLEIALILIWTLAAITGTQDPRFQGEQSS